LATIVHREATKLNALIAVERALNIPADETVAFGDDYSDIDCLSYCVNSIAVANAIDEVKSVANCICGDCDDDGVAKWLEENVL
jgi:hydroxymethylpyrimidine pyrophosphatase-like HAD family hydrolase